MKIRTGDSVLVIAGKDRGKTGTVTRVLKHTGRLVVEGVNMRTRHMKKTTQQAGQIIRYEASLHASNVMLLDPKTKKPTRVRFERDAKGVKQRIAVKSGQPIIKVKPTKAKSGQEGKGSQEGTVEKTKKVEATKSTTEAPAVPKKEAFWKRMTRRGETKTPEDSETRADDKAGAHPTMPKVHRSRESS